MVTLLVSVLIIVIICSAIAGILYYAPFVPASMRQWGIFVVGAIGVVLIIIQLLALFPVSPALHIG